MQIGDGVWQVDGLRAVNVFVIAHDDGIMLIDSGTLGSAPAILRYVSSLGYTPRDIRAIMLTHTHIDHLGGLPALHEASGASIYVSAEEAPVVEGQQPLPRPAGPPAAVFAVMNALLRPRPVSVAGHLHSGDQMPLLPDWCVVGTPGHTHGHVSFYHPEQELLIAGDAVANMGQLRRSPRIFTSNMAQAQRSVALLAGLKLRSAAFGHGPPVIDVPSLPAQLAALARADRYRA